MEIFFRDQQRIVYEIRLIAIREVSPPFGEEHRGLEQDISFPGNKHLLILREVLRCPHKRIVTITIASASSEKKLITMDNTNGGDVK